jgi:uncharacterized protein DUF5677
MRQRAFELETWGGKRKDAGRKPAAGREGIRHDARHAIRPSQPVHVTMRMAEHVWNLRSERGPCCGRLRYPAPSWAGVTVATMPVEFRFEGTIQVDDSDAQLVFVHDALIQAGEAALANVNATGEYPHAIALLLGHAVASAQALQIMCLAGRAHQARPTARAIVETVINAYYIARDPEVRAKRFWAYRPIPLAKVAEARARVFGITDQLDEIRAQAAGAKKQFPRNGWAGKNLRARAEECGMLAVYELYYPEASIFAHADASLWNVLVSEDGRTIKLGTSPAGIAEVVGPTISAMYPGLVLLARVFADGKLSTELQRIAAMLPHGTKRIDLSPQFEVIGRNA